MSVIWYSGTSHISGKSVLELVSSSSIQVTDSASLNIQQSFTFGIMIQPKGTLPPAEKSYAILCKGDPLNPSSGSIFIECIEGRVRVYLHNTNGVNSLVFESVGQILNTKKISHLVVVWDFNTKTFNMYLNDRGVAVQLVTGGSFHATASAMGLIRSNASDVSIGQATGKQSPTNLKLFHVFLADYAFTHQQVGEVYNLIKFTGSYSTTPGIVFSRIISGKSVIMRCNNDGSDVEVLYEDALNCFRPRVSESGEYFSFIRYVTSPVYIESALYLPISGAGTPSGLPAQVPGPYVSPDTPVILDYSNKSVGFLKAPDIFYTDLLRVYSFPGTGPSLSNIPFLSYGNYDVTSVNNTRPSGQPIAVWGNEIYDWSSLNTFDSGVYKARFNKLGTKLAYSKQVSGFYEVFIADSDGSNITQITSSGVLDKYVSGFTSDGLWIIYNTGSLAGLGTGSLNVVPSSGGTEYNISSGSTTDWNGQGF